MAAVDLVVHLVAADGSVFDLTVPAPVVAAAARVRVGPVGAWLISDVRRWTGTAWVTS